MPLGQALEPGEQHGRWLILIDMRHPVGSAHQGGAAPALGIGDLHPVAGRGKPNLLPKPIHEPSLGQDQRLSQAWIQDRYRDSTRILLRDMAAAGQTFHGPQAVPSPGATVTA